MRPEQRDLIRALPLFCDLGDIHFTELINAAFLQRFPAGVTLIRCENCQRLF